MATDDKKRVLEAVEKISDTLDELWPLAKRLAARLKDNGDDVTALPTEVGSPAYWKRYSWQWTVEVGDPSGEGNRSIIHGETEKERFGIGARNGQVAHLGAKILNLFELDHSYEVIEKVNAVIDAELAKRERRSASRA